MLHRASYPLELPVERGGPSCGRTAPNRRPLPPEMRRRSLRQAGARPRPRYFCGFSQRMKDWSPNSILAQSPEMLTSWKFPWNVWPSETTDTSPSTET
jgi:hypothetical protein